MKNRVVLAMAVAGVVFCLGCDRNIEPYDPDEQVVTPDLSRIFPEGAERAADDAGAVMPEPPTAAAGNSLAGTIRLAADLTDRVPSGSVLFLIARVGDAGPPTAVKRVVAPRFPLTFELGPEDRMIEAMPWGGPFQLSARVDADQNAMTRNPGDLQGQAKGRFEPGARGVEIVIDEIL